MQLRQEGRSSDPLPYTQVDRAVKAKACLLAGRLGVSSQHALGSLVEFWDLNGDPRQLEQLLLEGKDEVLLPGDEVRHRFLLASGKEMDPKDLVAFGLLDEKSPNVFRVRGMSRFFEPIRARIRSRLKASAAGKASAEARKAKLGTSQPCSTSSSEPSSNQVRAKFEPSSAQVELPPNSARTPPNPSVHRTSDSVHLLEEEATAAPTPPHKPDAQLLARTPKAPEDRFANGAAFFAWVQTLRVESEYLTEPAPHPSQLSKWWTEVGLETNGNYAGLEKALYAFGKDPFWDKKQMPFPGFMKHWRKYFPQGREAQYGLS
jgi:hypothetical protein